MLRHALAALAYRAAKVLRGAPAGFDSVRAADIVIGRLGIEQTPPATEFD